MSEIQTEPVLLEAGRYKLYQTVDGGWAVRRAVGICDSCQSCGCGEQADPIKVPGVLVQMAQSGVAAKMMEKMAAKQARKGGSGD